jgi:hypothetical protein
MVTEVRPEQYPKVPLPILVTPSLITTFLISSLRESQGAPSISPVPDMVNVPSPDKVHVTFAWIALKEITQRNKSNIFFIVGKNKKGRRLSD